jgi:ABC-2 type transport system ATP-binding protein
MSTTDTPALCLRHVSKRFNATHGIFNVTLDVQPGEVFGFLGPNGAGKSTTINTILNLLRPNEGTITIFGMDHQKDSRAVHQRIGYVAGDMETDPTLTGKQYLDFVAHIRGNIDVITVNNLAERLRADLTTKIKHLSRGNKQKIGLIAALMHDPDLLILDEPTSGLDPLIQAEFYEIIHERRARGKTSFISSHILNEIQGICDRVGFIRDGKLIHVDTLDHLLSRAPQRVTVHFAANTPISALKHIAGIHHARQSAGLVSFDFTGDTNTLLRVLAAHPVKSMTIAEPDLEKLFLQYYKSELHHVS